MSLQFELAGAQIDGARDYQEDAFLITHIDDEDGNPSALVVIADGMGGHAAGNVASNMAVQAFNKHVSANYPSDNIAAVLREAVIKANLAIQETIGETEALAGMGCTMIAGLLEKRHLWWASVGDSHLYLVHENELNKKNEDHSYGGYLDRMEAQGTPVEPQPGYSRNMLMSALTGEEISEIDVPETPHILEPGDRVLLCSDGMDTLSLGKIIQFSNWSDSPKECVAALLEAVEEANLPKQDNTTAVLVVIKGSEAAADAADMEGEEEEDITEPEGLAALNKDKSIPPHPADTPSVPELDIAFRTVDREVSEESAEETEATAGKAKLVKLAIAATVLIVAGIWFAMPGGDKAKPDDGDELGSLVAEADAKKKAPVPETKPEPAVAPAPAKPEPAVAPAPAKPEPAVAPAPAKPEPAVAPAPAKPEPAVALAPAKPEAPVVPAPAKPEPVAPTQPPPSSVLQDELKSGGKAPRMIVIPTGNFKMGVPGSRSISTERPRREVKVTRSFAVSEREITISEYALFANNAKKKLPKIPPGVDPETYPVTHVSWDNAYSYVRWLSEQTGHRYRLPSEAEWEYAATGGTDTLFWWGTTFVPKLAHCMGCETGLDPRRPTQVGFFKANPFGLFDTSGNVSEWVHDCWHPNFIDAPSYAEVWEGGDCNYRVVKGGAYDDPSDSMRVSKRNKFRATRGYDNIGIRVLRELN